MRGYDVEATRKLLEDAADEFAAAASKRDRLAEEVRRLQEELAASPSQEGDFGDKERLISEALIAATRTAESLREQGKQEGERAVAEAKARAEEILALAQREGEGLKAEAEKEAQALLKEVQAETRKLLAAREQERKDLKTEAERLRTLTDQTSANLRSLLVGMLEQLEERAAAPPSADADAAVSAEAAEHGVDPPAATPVGEAYPPVGERQGTNRR